MFRNILTKWKLLLMAIGGAGILGGGFYNLQDFTMSFSDFVNGTATNGYVVTSNNGTPEWQAPTGGSGSLTVTTSTISAIGTSSCTSTSHTPVASFGGDIQYSLMVIDDNSNETGTGETITTFVSHNENESNRTWIDEAGNTGHFSGAKDSRVIPNTRMKLAGDAATYKIVSIVGDGTGLGSVTLDADPGANANIDWIRGMDNSSQLQLYGRGTDVPTSTWFYSTQAATTTITGLQQINYLILDNVYSISTSTYDMAKIAIDNGAGLHYFDGTAWQLMTYNEFATKGSIVSSSTQRLLGSDYSDMTVADWGLLDVSNGFNIVWALYAEYETDAQYVQSYTYKYEALNTEYPVGFNAPGSFNATVSLVRTTSSTVEICNLSGMSTLPTSTLSIIQY